MIEQHLNDQLAERDAEIARWKRQYFAQVTACEEHDAKITRLEKGWDNATNTGAKYEVAVGQAHETIAERDATIAQQAAEIERLREMIDRAALAPSEPDGIECPCCGDEMVRPLPGGYYQDCMEATCGCAGLWVSCDEENAPYVSGDCTVDHDADTPALDKPAAEEGCVCAETSARNCPAHQNYGETTTEEK